MDEKRLIEKAKQGDKSSVNSLVELYYSDIFRFLARRHSDSVIAEDLTQDVFIKFACSLSTYKDKGNLKSYIFTIAVNCSNDYFRREKNFPNDTIDNYESILYSPSPVVDVEDKETALRVKQAVNSLNDGFRDVIILRYYHNMKLSDIGKVLHIPVATVKTRLHRATKILKETLKGDFYD